MSKRNIMEHFPIHNKCEDSKIKGRYFRRAVP